MGKTDDILAELEDLGATGLEPVHPLKAVEEVRIEEGQPPPLLLDTRGERMVQLADTLVEEFDRFISSATIMRAALQEMRDMWGPSHEAPEAPEPLEEEGEVLDEEEFEEPESVVEEPELSTQGVPSAMGNIELVVPAPVPLPPELE